MFVAREPTRREQEATVEFKRLLLLQNAAFVAMVNGEEKFAAYLGYKALQFAADQGLRLTAQTRSKQCGRCGLPRLDPPSKYSFSCTQSFNSVNRIPKTGHQTKSEHCKVSLYILLHYLSIFSYVVMLKAQRKDSIVSSEADEGTKEDDQIKGKCYSL